MIYTHVAAGGEHSENAFKLAWDLTPVHIAVLCFDHLITLGEEVDFIWRRKFTAATVLFVLNRYSTLIKTILGYLLLWTTSPTVSVLPLRRSASLT